jgi:hypothetical protein
MYVGEISEKPEFFQKPDYYYNYNYNVENGFDFVIHRNVIIYKPEN